MNHYYVTCRVFYGTSRWGAFETTTDTKHTLFIGMSYLIPGLFRAVIRSMEYDEGGDEVSIELQDTKIDSGTPEDMAALRETMTRVGWGFVEGRWDSEFLI